MGFQLNQIDGIKNLYLNSVLLFTSFIARAMYVATKIENNMVNHVIIFTS